MTIDPETGTEHISPIGLEHQGPQKSRDGIYFTGIRLRHFIIVEIQKAYPELAERMANNPDAANTLAAFLALVPLEAKGRLMPDLKRKVLEIYKLR